MLDIHIPKSRYIISLKNAIENLPTPSNKRSLKKLHRLIEITELLPDNYFPGLEILFKKNSLIFIKMGYGSFDILAKEPWLLRFFTWSADKAKVEGQRISLGGKMLELVVKNDKELHTSLENLAKKRHKELLETNFFPLEFDRKINPSTHYIKDLENFKVVKATDLTSGGKAFLDFSYFLHNESTGIAVVIIEGQIKREGAARYYIEQAKEDSFRIFKAGFECVVDGKKIAVKPNQVIVDELVGSKILVRSSNEILSIGNKSFTRDIPGVRKHSINETYNEFFTYDSTLGINKMLNDLFKLKTEIGQLKKP